MHIDQSYKYSYSDAVKVLVHKDTGEGDSSENYVEIVENHQPDFLG